MLLITSGLLIILGFSMIAFVMTLLLLRYSGWYETEYEWILTGVFPGSGLYVKERKTSSGCRIVAVFLFWPLVLFWKCIHIFFRYLGNISFYILKKLASLKIPKRKRVSKNFRNSPR